VSTLPPLVAPAAELTREEVVRYSRHLIIPDLGLDGQKRLKNARVLVIGAGGLGSPTLLYLAAAGVGTLGIVEFDVVDESNLQRQIIHGQSDIGRSKAQSARDSILEVNPLVNVRLHEFRLEADNAVDLFAEYDLILDGTDNFATRYLPVRGPGVGVLGGRPRRPGPQLPRPLSRTATPRHGAVVRRRRCARHPVRLDRVGDGNRGRETDHRHR
jgi:adenylyltransferase/sulfurtransferase